MIDLLQNYPSWLPLVVLGVCAAIVGSLLNVIIYRLPLMLQAEWRCECRTLLGLPREQIKTLNLFWPRSFCPGCKQTIPFWHNIPLLSYCILRGRCHRCQAVIPFRYFSVELMSVVLAVFAGLYFGFTPMLVWALIFIWIMICLCFIDLDHQLLPDSLNLGLLWLGLLANSQHLFTPLSEAVYSAVGAYMSLWLVIQAYYLLRGKIGMGHGDFKLFAAIGAWFGWKILPLVLLIACILGMITGLIYLKITRQSHDTPVPFGPFLCISGILALFWKHQLLHFVL